LGGRGDALPRPLRLAIGGGESHRLEGFLDRGTGDLGVGPYLLVHPGLHNGGACTPAPSTVDVGALHFGDLEITALLLAAPNNSTCASLARQVNLPTAGTTSVLHGPARSGMLSCYGELRG
ncbi:unnamed protein product, partial [Ectocarpus sp. 13 AM-2016]